MTTTYHYPSELFELMVDTIPRLVKTKRGVLEFFWGAGVDHSVTSDIEQQLHVNRDGVSKFHIARMVVLRLNEAGDNSLRERRELLKRVCEFDAFSTCWPEDQLQAKGLVADIRSVVEKHDFFRRLQRESETAIRNHREVERQRTNELRQRKEALETIRRDLYGLFGSDNPQQRGKQLETVLNRLFHVHNILVRESFELAAPSSHVANEQIDGVIEIDGHLYLVEMKWLKNRVDIVDVSRHIQRVLTRADCRGLIISYSGYTEPAVQACRDAMQHAPIVLCTLQEFVMSIENHIDIAAFLKEKVRRLIIDKQPFVDMTETMVDV